MSEVKKQKEFKGNRAGEKKEVCGIGMCGWQFTLNAAQLRKVRNAFKKKEKKKEQRRQKHSHGQ